MPSKRPDLKHILSDLSLDYLAKKCEVHSSYLWKLARDTNEIYNKPRAKPKPHGGTRKIESLKYQYKKLLRKFTRILTREILFHPAAHGGIPRRSSFTSARQHLGKKYIVTRDIKDCYPSITKNSLKRAFLRLGATIEFSEFLSSISTVKDHIPQGGTLIRQRYFCSRFL